jgi:hypothetical protein
MVAERFAESVVLPWCLISILLGCSTNLLLMVPFICQNLIDTDVPLCWSPFIICVLVSVELRKNLFIESVRLFIYKLIGP